MSALFQFFLFLLTLNNLALLGMGRLRTLINLVTAQGILLGGLLLGVIEALAAGYIAIAWKDAIAFTVLILILIIRPTGILGERTADKL